VRVPAGSFWTRLIALAAPCATSDAARFAFVGHLYAVCTALRHGGAFSVWKTGAELPQPRGWDDLSGWLRRVGSRPADTWYGSLIQLLQTLDSRYAQAYAREGPARSHTVPLEGLVFDDQPLPGEVELWTRPVSQLRALRDHTDGDHGPQRFDWSPARRLRHLSAIWRLPGPQQGPHLRRVYVPGVFAPTCAEAGQHLGRDGFRIALCPLDGPFWPRFRVADEGGGFHADEGAPMQSTSSSS
jgi:hypothetical protein